MAVALCNSRSSHDDTFVAMRCIAPIPVTDLRTSLEGFGCALKDCRKDYSCGNDRANSDKHIGRTGAEIYAVSEVVGFFL
jgi:hypothetical protein